MATIETKYSKQFIPATKKIFYLLKYSVQTREDLDLRKKIKEKFEFNKEEGFDGKLFYSWKIEDDLVFRNEKYQTIITIRKAGNKREIESSKTDLESFLILNSFKELK
jgi:hypothetical protein